MESRNLKIKDYVTHERVPVRGDSHGNFTLSPLGFPFVNRSGYQRGTKPPTTFSASMVSKPESFETTITPILEYKDEFKFPRTDSDHDTFQVNAILKVHGVGYSISSDSANFYQQAVVSVKVDDATYEQVNGIYHVDETNHIQVAQSTDIPDDFPEDGISCKVTFSPEETKDIVSPMFIQFTGSGDNNGVYKLVVQETPGSDIIRYTWMYKTSNEEIACGGEDNVTFDGSENDNVHDHYRNRVSDREVADYLNHMLGVAIECGKFHGAEYPVDSHGLLVKWFLSRGAIVHSVAGKTVVLDGFGHVLAKSDLSDCSGTPEDSNGGPYGIGIMHEWRMSTAGDYYPSYELNSDYNNISLEIEKSGERHTFIINQDLSDMVDAPPRKTFIHLPAGLDLADGTEIEMNIALPVVSQPNTVDSTEEKLEAAIKSYTDYVSQPRVYIVSGKQVPLPNNSVQDSGISTTSSSFTLRTKNSIDVENGAHIAFGLLNRYECSKTFHFVGVVRKNGNTTTIEVNGQFPYNRSSRRWKMYSKDATCIVDVRTVDEDGGLTEYTSDSGAFDKDKTLTPKFPADPKLIDEDSIIATVYPTSTNTFPWRLNGRNRVRHLGLTASSSVDYNENAKPLTRYVFEMNKKIYGHLSDMFHGYKPMSYLRYDDENTDDTVGHSILASLLRVALPTTLDADIDETKKDDMYVVANATKAFRELVGDFKVARVGYESSRGWNNKQETSWGYTADRQGDVCPLPDVSDPLEDGTEQRLNDWETKIIHLPNYCLGVDEELKRNLAYAGWNEYTRTDNFRIFYADDVDKFVDWDGYEGVGNTHYKEFKDDSGTTQRTVDNYKDDAEGDIPFNYTAENSVFKLFVVSKNKQTVNQYGAYVYGFLDLPIIKRGLRAISWLFVDEGHPGQESEFLNREMEPFYPSSHVISTDGVAFPDVNRNLLRDFIQHADVEDQDVKRALLAFPDKVVTFKDESTSDLSAELISVNIPNDDENPDPAVDYMKSLLTMYSNGMPLHMYDAHRAINVESFSDDYEQLLHTHEVTLYNRNAESDMQKQHRYCDLATNTTDGQGGEDVNMTYNFITGNALETSSAVSLTSALESVSSSFIETVFGARTDEDDITHNGMYTRIHISAVFSSSLGRWIVKDYRQYPTCYLTPLYGANTIDYTEKSYAYGNPSKYANRVSKNEGMVGEAFSILKYIGACEEQPLWQLPCGVGNDYRDGMYTRYFEQAPLEMNPGCIPFLMERFPYETDGTLNDTFKFRNLYESISTPMDANGESKEGAVPEVNFWNIKLHVRPARSAYPGADVPSNTARTGGTIAEPTLGMFHDLDEGIEGEIIITDDETNQTEYLIDDLTHIGPDIEVEPGDERVPYVILTDSDEYGSLVYDEPDPEGCSTKYVAVVTDNPLSPKYTD